MNNSSSAGKTSMVGVYILSLISVILWGMSYLWSDKLLSLGLPVEYVVFIRIFIASFLLLGYNLVKKYRIAISKIFPSSCCCLSSSRSFTSWPRLMASNILSHRLSVR